MEPDQLPSIIERLPSAWQPLAWALAALGSAGLYLSSRLRRPVPAAGAPAMDTVGTLATHLGNVNNRLALVEDALAEARERTQEAEKQAVEAQRELVEVYRAILAITLSGEPPEKVLDLTAMARMGLRRWEGGR